MLETVDLRLSILFTTYSNSAKRNKMDKRDISAWQLFLSTMNSARDTFLSTAAPLASEYEQQPQIAKHHSIARGFVANKKS